MLADIGIDSKEVLFREEKDKFGMDAVNIKK